MVDDSVVSNVSYTTRETCRVCGSDKLDSIFSLGNLYVSTFIDNPSEETIRAPLELVLCDNCSLLQLKHTAPQDFLYTGHYWYQSGLNPVICADLKEITQVALGMVNVQDNDIVLDIGANDGTMLEYYPESLTRVACEPARNFLPYLTKITPWVINDLWNFEAWYEMLGDKKAKIITAIGMFYDMDDPGQFIKDAARALDEDGIFIAQLMCLRPMLEKNDLGNICHEHLEYYSYDSLKCLFDRNGLEIFEVEENDINGGSYRLFARKYRQGSLEIDEKFTKKDYEEFHKRIQENKKGCVDFIKQEAKKGKKVYVYGASTKGNTILQYYGLDNELIKGAADKSPEKWGKYTVGTLIPIVSEAEAREKADYFLVLPWAFFNTFYEREKEWLAGGGKFIVPIPQFRIVGMEGDESDRV